MTPETEEWFCSEYGLVLANVIRLEPPVKKKGSLSFWSVPELTASKVLSALAPNQKALVVKKLLTR